MKKIAKWYQSLLKSLQLQLFISFISLPFLIAWGLPISLLTPISTLLFGPFLTCFLLISSLIFFLELFYLPNAFFIWCLEQITTIWLACLNLEQRAWLIGFQKPPMIILVCIPLIALAIVHNKKIISINYRTGLLGLMLVATCVVLKLFPYRHDAITTFPCNKGHITLINHKNTLTMIDPGYIASRPNYESFISYTLVPEIVQKTGSMQIDHLVICTFNKRVLDAVQFLATKMYIKNLYIPSWQGRIPPFAWRSYAILKKTILAQNGNIKSISYKKQLNNDQTCRISIEPSSNKPVSYYDATYKKLCINGTINNELFSL
jgi:hypothetical protein